MTRKTSGADVGFELTEVGTIPAEWDVDKVGAVAKIRTGSRNTQDRKPDGRYPFFVRSQEIERIDSYAFDGEAILTAGDGVGTGRVFHYIDGRFDFHQRVYKISDFSPRLDGYYFYLFFKANFFKRISAMTAKSSVDSVRMDMIADMPIALPVISEQKAIATSVKDVTEAIAALGKLITKKRAVKSAVTDRLLSGATRLPGFASERTQCVLGDLGAFSKGRGIGRGDVLPLGLPAIRYGELYTRYHDYTADLGSRISQVVAEQAMPIEPGTLLFAGSGETKEEIGKCVAYIGKGRAFAGGDIILLRPHTGDPVFLAYLLNHRKAARQKARLGQGDAVVHISSANLARVVLDIPEPGEQAAIAEVLLDLDREIDALMQKREKLTAIERSMTHSLLSGRVRLETSVVGQ